MVIVLLILSGCSRTVFSPVIATTRGLHHDEHARRAVLRPRRDVRDVEAELELQ